MATVYENLRESVAILRTQEVLLVSIDQKVFALVRSMLNLKIEENGHIVSCRIVGTVIVPVYDVLSVLPALITTRYSHPECCQPE